MKTPNPRKRQFARFGPPPADTPGDAVTVRVGEKPKREKKPKAKYDPQLVAAARELRDRWLEHVNAGASARLTSGKYDVTRALTSTSAVALPQAPGTSPALPSPEAA